MNITFLIGNGFDLNLGLKTKYKDFLKEYIDVKSNDFLIDIFKKDLLQDKELWANAEKAFGDYTDNFDDTNGGAKGFCICHEDFCIELASYLKKQEELIDFNNQSSKIRAGFVHGIRNFVNNFRNEPKTQISNYLNSFTGSFIYRFIDFNYTTTLDKSVSLIKNTSLLGVRNNNNKNYENSFGDLLHIHGYTYKDMVLGVNDETQIKNLNLFENESDTLLDQLIKINTNRMNEENNDENACLLLKSSHLIYIYGMSIGETDALWWKRICELMNNNKTLITIIHAFDAPEEGLIRRHYIEYERTMKKNFVNYSDYDDETKENLMKRIYIDRKNIFEEIKNIVNETENETIQDIQTLLAASR